MTRPFSFNLIDEPWLPCQSLAGQTNLLSLRELFAQAHRLRSLAGDSPIETAALFRFLLVILHRLFGPADPDSWLELWQAERIPQEAVAAYLADWHERFDLFHPDYPFFQAGDPRVKPKSIISLRHDWASGNNATLFDHNCEDAGLTLSPDRAARALITAQVFGLAGLSGIPQKFTDGAGAGGIIFLAAGANLKESLLLNLLPYPDESVFPTSAQDRPAWEMADPFQPDRQVPYGYLDYLTWQNRRILLRPEKDGGQVGVRTMTMAPGLRLDASMRDAMKLYRKHEKHGLLALTFSEERALWRDSASLLAIRSADDRDTVPHEGFKWLAELVTEGMLPRHQTYGCVALGMAKKQAKVFFFREERLPLDLHYLSDQRLVERLASALDQAEAAGRELRFALRLFGIYLQVSNPEEAAWQKLNPNTRDAVDDWIRHTAAEAHYWAGLDLPFRTLIAGLPAQPEPAQLAWQDAVRAAARAALDHAANFLSGDPRSFKGEVRGRSYLNYRLREALPILQEENI